LVLRDAIFLHFKMILVIDERIVNVKYEMYGTRYITGPKIIKYEIDYLPDIETWNTINTSIINRFKQILNVENNTEPEFIVNIVGSDIYVYFNANVVDDNIYLHLYKYSVTYYTKKQLYSEISALLEEVIPPYTTDFIHYNPKNQIISEAEYYDNAHNLIEIDNNDHEIYHTANDLGWTKVIRQTHIEFIAADDIDYYRELNEKNSSYIYGI
jgi:hypothetical protein